MSNKSAALPTIDTGYLEQRLLEMLAIPSPTGFTDEITRYVSGALGELGVEYKLSRRGTIIASLPGRNPKQGRAVVNHLDTIGATISGINPNGRPTLSPIGTWSSRFAEGGRVTVFSRDRVFRGQVLPILASGHAFNEQIDLLPISWQNLELRIDELVECAEDTAALGIRAGDFVAFDTNPEVAESGFISARHLDNKAGAASLLAAIEALVRNQRQPTTDMHCLFTVTEEVGTGASASLASHISEFIGIDIGPVAQGQNARETGVTLCAQDTSGPFDYHLLQQLKGLCREHEIPHQVDLFRYYYSDANSAITAGHDVRGALVTFGTDATHGYERTHRSSLESIANLLTAYALSAVESPRTLHTLADASALDGK